MEAVIEVTCWYLGGHFQFYIHGKLPHSEDINKNAEKQKVSVGDTLHVKLELQGVILLWESYATRQNIQIGDAEALLITYA